MLDGRVLSAIALFGCADCKFLPSSELKCMHFHGTEIKKPIPSYQVYKGTVFELVDLVIASQPYRARVPLEFKASKVLAPLVRALGPGGRLLGIHSYGRDPGLEIVRRVWTNEDPFKAGRHDVLRTVRAELGRDTRQFNFNAYSDARAVFRYDMHTLPTEISESIGTSTLLAKGQVSSPILGPIIPTMGPKLRLSDALFSGVQQRVLALLFGMPDRSFYRNELMQLARSGKGALQRELERLERSGLVTVRPQGNQRHYQANRAAPIFEELHGIVVKTFGVADVVRRHLAPLAERIQVAFIYGSVAKKTDTAASDVDLLVVSQEIGYQDLIEALQPAEKKIGRKINPTVYKPAELRRKRAERSSFVVRVLQQPKIFVVGSDGDLE